MKPPAVSSGRTWATDRADVAAGCDRCRRAPTDRSHLRAAEAGFPAAPPQLRPVPVLVSRW
jgi:hypothetical protein